MDRPWKPNVTVAAVVERGGRFLVVEEETVTGLRINQPAGHLESGESLAAAAAREALEETAYRFVPDCLVGIYQGTAPGNGFTYLRFAFGGAAAPDPIDAPLDAGIVRALWLAPDALRDCVERHRSPLVMRCVEDWIAGRRYGLDLLTHYR